MLFKLCDQKHCSPFALQYFSSAIRISIYSYNQSPLVDVSDTKHVGTLRIVGHVTAIMGNTNV